MAITKNLNTRLKLRYDSHENWITNDPVLLAGEVALSTVTVKQNGVVNSVPSVLIKVGDGTHKYSELDFAFARAADVLEQAKDAEKLTAFINNVIAEAGIATDEALSTLAGRVTTVEGAITTLNADASTAGSVAKAVSDGVTPVANRVTAIENKVNDDKVAQWDAAQANKIESIKVGDTALTIGEDKSVTLPAATAAALGLVKVDGTSIESKNGVIGVKAVNVSTLYVADGDELVLNGGNA